MSEDERGPYTPPRESPLQFDARRARDARPMPMTLIASGVVLVLLIGGVIMAYAGGFHRKDDPSKAVGDRVLVMKTAPTPGAASSTAPADQTVALNPAAAPTFAATPEEPAPRPKPQLQLKAQSLPPVRIASGEDETAPTAAGATPSTPTSTLLPTTRPPAAAKAKPVETAAAEKPTSTVIPKAAPAKASAAAVPGGPAGVQIGAFSSRQQADEGFAAVGKLVPTGGHGKRIEAVERSGSTLYRTTVTGFADRDAAKSFCERLTAKGHACIVKG